MSSGIVTTHTILDKIIAHKTTEIAAAMAQRSLAEVQAACADVPPPPDFVRALRQPTVALIAEVKHASPSKGVLIENFNPVELGKFYAEHGAAAISVLTDEKFFQGHLEHLQAIRAQVAVPLLRKDFTISAYQLYQARAAGAAAILLIAAHLEDHLMGELHALATELGLAALVEVHTESELERALQLKPRLIGVNNRNLHDFSVDLNTTRRLATHVPAEIVLVGESGIRTAADVEALGAVDAILVGETIVTAPDRRAVMQALTTIPRQERS